jgi:hypothetical protein
MELNIKLDFAEAKIFLIFASVKNLGDKKENEDFDK